MVGITTGFVLLFFAAKDLNPSQILTVLLKLQPLPFVIGVFFFVTCIFLKALRWQTILHEENLPFSTVLSALSISYFVNNILPARLGEVARIYLIGRQRKVGVAKTIGSLAAEKTLDIVVLLFFLFFSLSRIPQMKSTLPLLGGLTSAPRIKTLFKNFFAAFRFLKNKKVLTACLCLSTLIWIFEAMWNYSLIRSLQIPLPLIAAFFLAAITNIGLLIPSPPGYIGVFHFLVTFSLITFGAEKADAFSLALLQHTTEYLLLTILGIYSAFKLSFDPLEQKWQKP